MDDFADYDRTTAEETAARLKQIKDLETDLSIRRTQTSELAKTIRDRRKELAGYTLKRAAERGKLRQRDFDDVLPGFLNGDGRQRADAGQPGPDVDGAGAAASSAA